jgi:hypothetical protein
MTSFPGVPLITPAPVIVGVNQLQVPTGIALACDPPNEMESTEINATPAILPQRFIPRPSSFRAAATHPRTPRVIEPLFRMSLHSPSLTILLQQ